MNIGPVILLLGEKMVHVNLTADARLRTSEAPEDLNAAPEGLSEALETPEVKLHRFSETYACTYKASALRENPSTSLEDTSRFLEEALRFAPQMHLHVGKVF